MTDHFRHRAAQNRGYRQLYDDLQRGRVSEQSDGLPLFESAPAPPPPPPPSRFDVGMAASQASATVNWTADQQDAVDAAIQSCAVESPQGFTADHIWDRLGVGFPVTKGLAARLNSAARRGVIHNTGQTAICQRGNAHDHAQRLTIWAAGPARRETVAA